MSTRGLFALVVLAAACSLAVAQDVPDSAANDPVVRAMKTELSRSMEQLRLEHAQPPYYIEYSVIDLDQFHRQCNLRRTPQSPANPGASGACRGPRRRL